ncbi:glycoside hydrolase family 5 protein [Panacibacter ginsenosidivorans]|uniref:Glycoside hydrolase family 5 protein n=1 Tax=Panacibacter ginsenosidivorans TaxID=1813871 RepID=A0A5B8V9H0_9BACT|nr:cellulase family glycosylhydrolase [Panacibacter ginsenosidivorans]QEC67366.1 glycoside hydrolase family 5 protein [Panacibacter ginsenosidivorans]
MKLKIFSFCCLITLGIQANAQKFITTKGKNIIGVDGKPFLMKGTNLGNWLVPEGYMFRFSNTNSPRLINQAFTELIGPDATKAFWKKYLDVYITQEDIHYLKRIGMNSIRVPFNYRLFTNENYMGDNDSTRGFTMLNRVIKWCKAEGLYVLLDMHCAPGGQTGDNIDDGSGYPFLFENEESQQQCVNIWKKIAAHYANEPTVIGYDLLNEPIAHYFDKDKLNPLLEPMYKKITIAIRMVDKNHLLFLGGAQWDSNFQPFGAPFDSKLVYTFHKYWTAPTKEVIQDYIDFSNKYNVPLYCGETGENDDAWVEAFRKTLDENNIGWHYWPYKKMDNTKGIITFKVPQYYDQVIQFADTTRRSFEDIRSNRPKNIEEIEAALNGFLENCAFKNCIPNEGYIKALGFNFTLDSKK